MAIILRVDVDKPYGKHTLTRRIASKIKEDFFPLWKLHTGYLTHLKEMIIFCNNQGVRGTFYHRLCTAPNQEILNLLKEGGHQFGLHLENSKSKESFLLEWENFHSFPNCLNAKTFSKHGSGVHKLGKYHYPIYEPEKYIQWANECGYEYPSGNGIASCASELYEDENGYYPNLFWIEPSYRHQGFRNIDEVLFVAKKRNVVVLIHPCNFKADSETRDDFFLLIKRAKSEKIPVISFLNQ